MKCDIRDQKTWKIYFHFCLVSYFVEDTEISVVSNIKFSNFDEDKKKVRRVWTPLPPLSMGHPQNSNCPPNVIERFDNLNIIYTKGRPTNGTIRYTREM